MEFFKNRLAHVMGILLPLAFVLAATAAPVAPSRTPITFHAFPAAASPTACEPAVRLPVATSYNASTAYDVGQTYFVAAESATPFQQIMANLQRRDFSAVPNTALFYSGMGTGGIAEAGVEGVLKEGAAGAAADASAAKALQEQAAALERLVGHGGGLTDITGSEQGVETAGRESVVAAKAAEGATERIPGASDEEHAIDQVLKGEGRKVKPNLEEGQQGVGRQGDRLVDGKLTEYKSISGVKNTDADSLSGAIANRVMGGRGQAGDIIVDVRRQPGMTKEIAERGIARAYGADNKAGGKIQSIRVIGRGFDVAVRRNR